MGAGLEVFGEDGNVLIDDLWPNYALVQKVTIVSSRQNTIAPAYNGSALYGTQEGDLVFAYCASQFAVIGTMYFNGNRIHGVATFNVGVPVTFYVFRRQPPRDSKYGLQVFDNNEQPVFDAASDFIKVVYAIPPSDVYLSKAHALGNKSYAVLVPSFCGQINQAWYFSNGGQFQWIIRMDVYCPSMVFYAGGVETVGLKVIAFSEIPDNTGRAPTVTAANPVQIIFADVSGF